MPQQKLVKCEPETGINFEFWLSYSYWGVAEKGADQVQSKLLRKAGINIIISKQDAVQSVMGYSFSFWANADEDETKHRHKFREGEAFPCVCVRVFVYVWVVAWGSVLCRLPHINEPSATKLS